VDINDLTEQELAIAVDRFEAGWNAAVREIGKDPQRLWAEGFAAGRTFQQARDKPSPMD
jgi:hypothetical protein